MFFSDTFTGTTGAQLQGHTPDTGTGWTSDGGGDWRIDDNRVAPDSDFGRYVTTDAPDDADYDVEADFVHIGTTVTTGPEMTGRWVDTNNGLRVRSISDGVRLVEVDGGTFTNLGEWNGATWGDFVSHNVRLEMRGTAVKVFVDGVERISATTSVTAAGKPGVFANGVSTYQVDGIKFDNFVATNAASGTPVSKTTTLQSQHLAEAVNARAVQSHHLLSGAVPLEVQAHHLAEVSAAQTVQAHHIAPVERSLTIVAHHLAQEAPGTGPGGGKGKKKGLALGKGWI